MTGIHYESWCRSNWYKFRRLWRAARSIGKINVQIVTRGAWSAGKGCKAEFATNLRNPQRIFGRIIHQLPNLAIIRDFNLQFMSDGICCQSQCWQRIRGVKNSERGETASSTTATLLGFWDKCQREACYSAWQVAESERVGQGSKRTCCHRRAALVWTSTPWWQRREKGMKEMRKRTGGGKKAEEQRGRRR